MFGMANGSMVGVVVVYERYMGHLSRLLHSLQSTLLLAHLIPSRFLRAGVYVPPLGAVKAVVLAVPLAAVAGLTSFADKPLSLPASGIGGT